VASFGADGLWQPIVSASPRAVAIHSVLLRVISESPCERIVNARTPVEPEKAFFLRDLRGDVAEGLW